MEDILNILRPVKFDDSLAHYEIHSHQPYNSSAFNNSDEIRIPVQNQDQYILPSKSTLHVTGRLVKANNTNVTNTKLISNSVSFLFIEIRHELSGVEIDPCKNVGLTTTMKAYVSHTPNQLIYAENAGYLEFDDDLRITNENGYFDVNIPLNMIFGFAEDYRKIVVNAKHELILTISRTDLNTIVDITATEEHEQFKIIINKVEWLIPYIFLGDRQKIELLKFIEKDPLISMSFRSWDMYGYPLLPTTQKHVWTVKTSTQVEKPRYVILGLQINRKDHPGRYANIFDSYNTAAYCLIIHDRIIQYTPISNVVKKVS
ncbi:uncharacterized protein LOC127277865 [Leptopilina boulardi]|uniref:uncharacterized protein LOC127277865 n=1 Tax=Leptopilina boulardi TaxID=63433 RepID=UPI0021F633DD|nr:uncharacterized protein LOC127277865 [Leptopilina boulardi]